MCANFVVDLNGNKGPNIAGKDITFITAFYSDEPVVVASKQRWGSGGFDFPDRAVKACMNFDSNTRIPNKEEMSSIMLNSKFYGLELESDFWAHPIRKYIINGNEEVTGITVSIYGSIGVDLSIDWWYVCVDR